MNRANPHKPLLVIGMHRSGTSMVTRLLNLCGLHLGNAERLMAAHPDNPEGYWESLDFVALDDKILGTVKAAWDLPPTGNPNPVADPALLQKFRAQAEGCISATVTGLEARPEESIAPGAWGWKDPRCSLLLPFWSELLPGMKTVVCLRHPLEVAASLTKRNGFSTQLGLHLWQRYNDQLMRDLGADSKVRSIVTHYEAMLASPEQELRRLTDWLGWNVPDEMITSACGTIKSELRRQRRGTHQAALDIGPEGLPALYDRLCTRAGPNYSAGPQLDPQQLEDLNCQGEDRFNAGDFLLAVTFFRQALAGNTQHTRSRNNLACALWQCGRQDEAIIELARVLDAQPDDLDATWNMGQFLQQVNRLDEATRILESYLDRNPSAGDISRELNRLKEAGAVPVS